MTAAEIVKSQNLCDLKEQKFMFCSVKSPVGRRVSLGDSELGSHLGIPTDSDWSQRLVSFHM